MNTIELIKKYERNLDLEHFFFEVVKWNTIAGKLECPDAIANQPLLIKEEFQEILDATTPEEYLDGLLDTFVVSAQQYYNQFRSYPDFNADINSVAEGLDCIKKAIECEEYWKVYLFIESILNKCNFDVKGCLEEVMRSNFSKFPSFKEFEDEEYCKMECERIEKEGRYVGVGYSLVEVDDDTLVVFKDNNQKVVKYYGFSEANLAGFV